MPETVAERHNNPLNIKVGPATQHWVDEGLAEVGEPAKDGGNFLRFKSPLTGLRAGQELLSGPRYNNLSVDEAMKAWSNKGYGEEVAPGMEGKNISDLSDTQQTYLISQMAKREGYRGLGNIEETPTPEPVRQKAPPFSDIAKNFDPMMPQEDYDKIRQNYYYTVVAPQLSSPAAVQKGWEDFKKGTERTPLLNPLQRKLTQVGVGALSFARELVEPVAGAAQGLKYFGSQNVENVADVEAATTQDKAKMSLTRFLTTQEDEMTKVAEREGVDTRYAKVAGSMVGAVPSLTASYAMTGPLASALVLPEAGEIVSALKFANRVLHGGLAFSTLQAAREQGGNRLVVGLKGFSEGAAFEAGLGLLSLPKYLRAAADVKVPEGVATSVARDVATGKPIGERIDQKAAEYIKNQNELARQEARPSFVNEDSSTRGVWATLRNREGQEIKLGVKPGEERALVNQINAAIDKGGTLAGIDYHPLDQSLLTDFMGAIQEKSAAKYEYTKRVVVPEGTAEKVAEQAQAAGVAASATSPSAVQVEGVRAEPPLPKGVTFLGDQDTLDPNVKYKLYNLKVKEGEATFVVKPGEDIEAKAAAARAKFEPPMPKMSEERARLLVKQMGGNPDTADIATIQEMGEAEITRVLEESAAAKKAGLANTMPRSLLEEKIRLQGSAGGSKFASYIPSSERPGANMGQVQPNPELRFHQFAVTSEIPATHPLLAPFQATAVEYPDWKEMATDLGRDVRGYENLKLPGIIYSPEASAGERYHELVHAGLDHMGFDFKETLKPMMQDYLGTGRKELYNPSLELFPIAQNLMKEAGNTYGNKPLSSLLNEAFTYSAQAIRTGDQHLLNLLGEWNGGPGGVIKAVNEMSKILLDRIPDKIDSINSRIIQRGLEDLVRRTDKGVSYALRRAASGVIKGDPYWDGSAGKWLIREGEKDVSYFTDLKQVWDDFAKRDEGLDHMPSLSFFSELMGVRGPLKPGGPPRTPPMPVEPVEGMWKKLGWTAIRGLLEPALPFAAAADKKMNALFEKSGGYMPIYRVVKDLFEGQEKATAARGDLREIFGKILQGTPEAKHHDYFETLTQMGITTESRVIPGEFVEGRPRIDVLRKAGTVDQALIDRYKLDPSDVTRITQTQQALLDMQEKSKIPIMEYLTRFFPRLRGANWNPGSVWGNNAPGSEGFWEDAVRNGKGHFDPQDTHLGRFVGWTIDQSAQRQYLDKSLRELDTIVNRKSPDGKYILGPIRYPLFNLSRYMRGIPDTSQQILNSAIGTFSEGLGKKFEEMNKFLPEGAQLPTEFGSPQSLMSKWMLFSYAAGAGTRPALILRDALQAFLTSFPLMGPGRFFSGMAKTLTRDGWEAAERAGAHLGHTNMGELYGDVFNELPVGGDRSALVRFANMVVQPLRWGNDLARTLTYNGEYDAALPIIQRIRAGEADVSALLKGTSLKWHDEANISRLLGRVMDAGQPAEEVAKRLALDTVHLTQWPYLRGSQPAILRTGAGRLFGQYGTWPLNYISFLGRMGAKAAHPEMRNDAIQATAYWVGINWATGAALEKSFGVDSSNWVWGSPAVYTGGPAFQLGQDIMKAMGDTDESRKARKDLLTSPKYLIPAYTELKNIITAINESGDPGHKDFLRVLGFKPLDKVEQDKDIQEWIKYQAGMPQH